MASVWGELKRRNVVRVAVAYAVVGWLLIEIASTVFPLLYLPEWTATFVAALLIMGFPLALILSWAYELTPEGMKRSHEVPAADSITHTTGRRIDFVIIGVLAMAVLFMLVDNYLPQSGPFAGAEIDPASLEPPPLAAGGEPATTIGEGEQPQVLPNSVAVLLFDNLSPNPDDAYFAAGLHEEILNHLAKLRNLSVISRTSILRYADSDLSIPEIARALNVETVMEGTVRYADGRVRITTQLIDAATDEHLWSETYDRAFEDIFAIESDIAMNVANALQAEFSLAEQERIAEIPTESSAAYALYLKATTQPPALAIETLDNAIALDPEYAQAYGYKALRLTNRMRTADVDEEAWEPVVQEAAAQALTLDPNVASAHAALAGLHAANWRWAEARQAYETIYQLNPNNTEILWAYGNFMRDIGDYDQSVRLLERVTELDPSPASSYQLGISYRYARDDAAAAATFRKIIETEPAVPLHHMQLAITQIVRGDRDEGFRELQTAEQLWFDGVPTNRIPQMALAYAHIDRRQDVERLVSEFEDKANESPVGQAQWAMIYLALGDYDQAFTRLETMLRDPAGEFRFGQLKVNDYRDPVLDEPEWQALRDRIGALD